VRIERQQRRGRALAREDRNIAGLDPSTPSAAVGVTPAFDLEKDEQLVGAVRDRGGPPRHD